MYVGDHRATCVGQGATCSRCHVHAFAQRVSADSGFPDTFLRVSICLHCRNGRVRGRASSHRFSVAWSFGRYSAPGRHSDHENKECPTQRRTGSYGIAARTSLGCVLTTVAACTPRPNLCQLCCARVLCGGVVGVLDDQVSYKRPVEFKFLSALTSSAVMNARSCNRCEYWKTPPREPKRLTGGVVRSSLRPRRQKARAAKSSP